MASRLHASYVSIFQRLCDVIAIYGSLYIVCFFNHVVINNQTLLAFLGLVSIFQLMGGLTDFYRYWKGISLADELLSCFQNISLSVICFYVISLLFTQIQWQIALQFLLCLIVLMGMFRVSIRILYSLFFKCFDISNKVLVIGSSEKAFKLYHDLSTSKWTGDRPVGIHCFDSKSCDQRFTGGLDYAIETVRSGGIRKVYIVMDQANVKQAETLLEVLADSTCSTILVPDLFNFNFLYSRVEDINGTAAIPLFDSRINGINTLLKRIEDICVASIILVLISPVLFSIAIAIKLTSKGPVFFRQIRYGLNGKPILVYKFRTMNVMENGAKVTQAVKNDPRVTKVGGFLRRTSLDELPQFFNVIIGNMSVVGPRPHAVAHNEEYRKLITGYMLRHKVKPGITGLAQINGWRGETDTLDKMEKRIECDLEYIRAWSLWLDIKIIFLTIFKGFIHKSAY